MIGVGGASHLQQLPWRLTGCTHPALRSSGTPSTQPEHAPDITGALQDRLIAGSRIIEYTLCRLPTRTRMIGRFE